MGFSAAATLAFVMAAGFIADTASLPVVVSDLVHIVSAHYCSIGFTDYAAIMMPVNLVSILASLCVLVVFFKRGIPAVYSLTHLSEPLKAIKDPVTPTRRSVVLSSLLSGFLGLEPLWVRLRPVAAMEAALLLADG